MIHRVWLTMLDGLLMPIHLNSINHLSGKNHIDNYTINYMFGSQMYHSTRQQNTCISIGKEQHEHQIMHVLALNYFKNKQNVQVKAK